MHFYFFDIWKSELSLRFSHMLKMEKILTSFSSGAIFIFEDWPLRILTPGLRHPDTPV